MDPDLSLGHVPDNPSSDSIVTLEEFLSSIEAAARIGRWEDNDTREIAALKLSGSAKAFYQGCTVLHEADATWQTFKDALWDTYVDVHTDQLHFTRLQTARQAKGETPQELADRCKGLALKIIVKMDDPLAQRVYRENAERMLLATFISGLTGKPGRQVRYANPHTLEQALKIALSVEEAEKEERLNWSFYTQCDESLACRTDPLVQYEVETEANVTQMTCSRSITRTIGNAAVEALTPNQRKAARGKRRQSPHRAATNVMASGISPQNA
jgi:hypothetical protein